MMEKLIFDTGVQEYQINDTGVLRFNPSDPNVYARFMGAMDMIESVEATLIEKSKEIEKIEGQIESGTAVLKLMAEADMEVKKILTEVFGGSNDFDQILGGVNLMAVASNGERVITNFLAAIQPVMVSGAEKCAKQQVDTAVAEAKLSREQRRG